MGKNAINYARIGWAGNALSTNNRCAVERKQTKTYGVVAYLELMYGFFA